MSEQEWPDEARKAVAIALFEHNGALPEYTGWDEFLPEVDAVLAALAPHVVPRDEEWEWGIRRPWRGSMVEDPADDEDDAREVEALAAQRKWEGWAVVRRVPARPAGPWEVAPDA